MRRFKPWWFCCGWRSYWCVADTIAHLVKWAPRWLCDRHDRALMRHWDAAEPAKVVGRPEVRITSAPPGTEINPGQQTWSSWGPR